VGLRGHECAILYHSFSFKQPAGKTTAEMQNDDTFINIGWDFVDKAANGTEYIWRILEGKDYLRLWS
jgi:hypothetical protein